MENKEREYLSKRNQSQKANKTTNKEKTSHPTNPRLFSTPRCISFCINPCLLIRFSIQTQ